MHLLDRRRRGDLTECHKNSWCHRNYVLKGVIKNYYVSRVITDALFGGSHSESEASVFVVFQ